MHGYHVFIRFFYFIVHNKFFLLYFRSNFLCSLEPSQHSLLLYNYNVILQLYFLFYDNGNAQRSVENKGENEVKIYCSAYLWYSCLVWSIDKHRCIVIYVWYANNNWNASFASCWTYRTRYLDKLDKIIGSLCVFFIIWRITTGSSMWKFDFLLKCTKTYLENDVT